MPFIGRDWRSPGEAWVKTESLGWQRMKIIESQLYSPCQQNPACSWPPKSEYGQHMVKNCKTDHLNDGRSSSGFRGSLSSGCSSSSSRCGSTSPSPSSSPEKNINNLSPLKVSSPYGRYSCCAHHFESTPQKNESQLPTSSSSQPNAQSMSASLSSEAIKTESTASSRHKLHFDSEGSSFQNTTTSVKEDVSDENSQNEGTDPPQMGDKLAERACYSNPILLKNGAKLEESSDTPISDFCDDQDSHLKQWHNIQTSTCCCSANASHRGFCHTKETRTAPHCRISVRTREVAMYNTISEAFYRLDFCNAIHDIRRFNYICKLLHLLITQNLTSLSGCATKVLFNMLEQVAWEVSSNKRNIHVLKNLLNELKLMIQKYYCWGRPIGSSLLWQQHFDTIERISQIVEGIELSPPKNESDQITFDNLPVEMIREILLRLNDYRDLVNSAQASPVMRTMVNGHHIWQQLCRYHFSEQQLKMALDNQNGQFLRKSNARGLKYARTTSADGRTSFRNPVSHSNKLKSSTRQQLEQTGGRRNSRQGTNTADKLATSYVTKAIRIFDKAGSSTSSSSSVTPNKVLKANQGCKKPNENRATTSQETALAAGQRSSHVGTTNRLDHEIDWERVFHQLRKKYDLKEEYADCLLLCRHCRCLFWKSFGHPCIKNDNSSSNEACSSFRIDNSCSIIGNANAQNVCNCDTINQERIMGAQSDQEAQVRNQQEHRRLSVAALSRNFDNRAQRSDYPPDNAENLPPQSNPHSNNRVLQSLRDLQNDNLNSEARGRGLRLNRRMIEENNNNNNNNNNNRENSPLAQANMKQVELVPKHVAISPQAFLKFFSL